MITSKSLESTHLRSIMQGHWSKDAVDCNCNNSWKRLAGMDFAQFSPRLSMESCISEHPGHWPHHTSHGMPAGAGNLLPQHVCPTYVENPHRRLRHLPAIGFADDETFHFQRKQRPVLSAALKQNNRILADLGSNIWKVDDMNSNRTSYSKNDLENDQFRDQAEPQQWPEYCVALAPHAVACGCSWALAQDITLVVLRSPIQSSLQANQAAQPQCERPESSRIHVLIGGICSSDIHFDPTALVTRARKAWLCISRAKVCIS